MIRISSALQRRHDCSQDRSEGEKLTTVSLPRREL